MRKRRIENEWRLLGESAALNPAAVQVLERGIGLEGEYFRLRLNQTSGPIQAERGIELRDSHLIEFRFPGFFPAVPIEAVMLQPVFHPNVDPDNGFVCLWARVSPGGTVAEALMRLQRVIAWELVNLTPDHVMQTDAAAWYEDASRMIALPCGFTPLILPQPMDYLASSRQISLRKRQRLFEMR
jgi:hypothetical protein